MQSLPSARRLYAADLPELCALDEKLIRQRLAKVPAGETSVALIPDINNIRWHQAREEFVGNELYGRMPDVKGAIVGTEPGKRVWCYWTRLWYNPNPSESKDNAMNILRLVIEDEEHAGDYVDAISALFAAALEQAKQWNMEVIESWNPTQEVVEGARRLVPEAAVVDRDMDSITSMMWYGRAEEKVDWIMNEKYGWC